MRLIYIAGRYSAKSASEIEENVELAKLAGHVVRSWGYEPLVPHIAVLEPLGESSEERWKTAMRSCLVFLGRCDGVVMLPNWRKSRGARIERWISIRRGIPVFENLSDLALLHSCDLDHKSA